MSLITTVAQSIKDAIILEDSIAATSIFLTGDTGQKPSTRLEITVVCDGYASDYTTPLLPNTTIRNAKSFQVTFRAIWPIGASSQGLDLIGESVLGYPDKSVFSGIDVLQSSLAGQSMEVAAADEEGTESFIHDTVLTFHINI